MEIPYGKVCVYVLTFLGYAYSGYGSGLLGNLKDAVLSAQNVFGNVVGNIITVAQQFKNFNDFLGANVDEYCVFKCPNGDNPKRNKFYTPKPNGCGSLGLQINTQYLPVAEMGKCCDAHDICYGTCNNDKEACDIEFKRCLYKYCATYTTSLGETMTNACKGAAKLLFTGTSTLGCKPYIDAQTEACYCSPTKRKTYAGGEL